MSKFIDIPTETIERLLPLLPLRMLLRKIDDKWHGLIECSFAMDWSPEYVQVNWSGTYFSNLGTTGTIDAIKSSDYHYQQYSKKYQDVVVLDPTTPDCPIMIDFEAWLDAKTKFFRRNAPFKVVKDIINVAA